MIIGKLTLGCAECGILDELLVRIINLLSFAILIIEIILLLKMQPSLQQHQ